MANVTRCRSCDAEIVFLKTGKLDANGQPKFMPVNADNVVDWEDTFNPKVHISHFATCPAAQEWRGKKAGYHD